MSSDNKGLFSPYGNYLTQASLPALAATRARKTDELVQFSYGNFDKYSDKFYFTKDYVKFPIIFHNNQLDFSKLTVCYDIPKQDNIIIFPEMFTHGVQKRRGYSFDSAHSFCADLKLYFTPGVYQDVVNKFYKKILAFENKIIQDAISKSKLWFNKEIDRKEAETMFRPIIRFTKKNNENRHPSNAFINICIGFDEDSWKPDSDSDSDSDSDNDNDFMNRLLLRRNNHRELIEINNGYECTIRQLQALIGRGWVSIACKCYLWKNQREFGVKFVIIGHYRRRKQRIRCWPYPNYNKSGDIWRIVSKEIPLSNIYPWTRNKRKAIYSKLKEQVRILAEAAQKGWLVRITKRNDIITGILPNNFNAFWDHVPQYDEHQLERLSNYSALHMAHLRVLIISKWQTQSSDEYAAHPRWSGEPSEACGYGKYFVRARHTRQEIMHKLKVALSHDSSVRSSAAASAWRQRCEATLRGLVGPRPDYVQDVPCQENCSCWSEAKPGYIYSDGIGGFVRIEILEHHGVRKPPNPVIKIQSIIRMYLKRKTYLEILSLKPDGAGYLKCKNEFEGLI